MSEALAPAPRRRRGAASSPAATPGTPRSGTRSRRWRPRSRPASSTSSPSTTRARPLADADAVRRTTDRGRARARRRDPGRARSTGIRRDRLRRRSRVTWSAVQTPQAFRAGDAAGGVRARPRPTASRAPTPRRASSATPDLRDRRGARAARSTSRSPSPRTSSLAEPAGHAGRASSASSMRTSSAESTRRALRRGLDQLDDGIAVAQQRRPGAPRSSVGQRRSGSATTDGRQHHRRDDRAPARPGPRCSPTHAAVDAP